MNYIEISNILEGILQDEKLSKRSQSAIHRLLTEFKPKMVSDYPETTDLVFAANRIIDAGFKTKWDRYHGAWMVSGNQYVTDGHRAMKIFQPISLRKLPETTKPATSVPGLFDNPDWYTERIPCPSVSELKQLILNSLKLQGKLVHIIYQMSPEISVNAEYLLDALIATGAKSARTKLEDGKCLKGVLFESNICSVLVLPVYFSKQVSVGTCYALYK